jgi:hypothetical protein
MRNYRLSIFLVIALPAVSAFADEGMWLFNNPPLKQLKEKYQFEPSPPWLEHLQKSQRGSAHCSREVPRRAPPASG